MGSDTTHSQRDNTALQPSASSIALGVVDNVLNYFPAYIATGVIGMVLFFGDNALNFSGPKVDRTEEKTRFDGKNIQTQEPSNRSNGFATESLHKTN